MVLWRISRHRDLTGTGGLRASGRWHYAGQPVVYLAESPASALLEGCVHTSANDLPPEFTLLKIEESDKGSKAAKVLSINPEELSPDWTTRLEVTRDIGTEWLRRGEAVLLRIPSAIVPATTNLLFNPLHAQAQRFSIVETFSYPFDVRLKK